MAHYEKELDKYEKSVEEHVKKVNYQLDEELANINRKFKEKVEMMRKMEAENKKTREENERMRQRMETKKKKMASFEKKILKNKSNLMSFEAHIADIHEKLPERRKNIEEIQKSLNEKRRQVLERQSEYGSYRLNRTENSQKTKLEKTRKRLEEMKKKKIAQDKKIARLRADIVKSEKSYEKIEREMRKEIERQFENESKKDEIERRIKIFEVENSGITDEFQKLLVSLNENSELREKNAEKRMGELKVMMTKGEKYIEKLDEKIKNMREMKCAPPKSVDRAHLQPTRKRSKSEKPPRNWKRLEELKKQIIQLKRESEALAMNKMRLSEEGSALYGTRVQI